MSAGTEQAAEYYQEQEAKAADEERARKNRRDNELIDLQQVMGTKSGRALIWRTLERGRAFQTPFVAGMPDLTAFNCGEQNVARWLLAEIMEAAPEGFALMQEEQRNVAV